MDVIVIGGGDTGHGLRRHVAAARLQEPPATGGRAAAARQAVPRTTLADVAKDLSPRLRPGEPKAQLRRRSATVFHPDDEVRRRRCRTSEGDPHRSRRVGADNGRTVPETSPARRQVFRPSSSCWRWASAAGEPASRPARRGEGARTNAKTENGKFGTSVKGVFAAGTCGAGRVWSSGRSTRAAGRPECDSYLMVCRLLRNGVSLFPASQRGRCGSERGK